MDGIDFKKAKKKLKNKIIPNIKMYIIFLIGRKFLAPAKMKPK